MAGVTEALNKLVGSFNAVADAAKAESDRIIEERQKTEASLLPKSDMIPGPLANEAKR